MLRINKGMWKDYQRKYLKYKKKYQAAKLFNSMYSGMEMVGGAVNAKAPPTKDIPLINDSSLRAIIFESESKMADDEMLKKLVGHGDITCLGFKTPDAYKYLAALNKENVAGRNVLSLVLAVAKVLAPRSKSDPSSDPVSSRMNDVQKKDCYMELRRVAKAAKDALGEIECLGFKTPKDAYNYLAALNKEYMAGHNVLSLVMTVAKVLELASSHTYDSSSDPASSRMKDVQNKYCYANLRRIAKAAKRAIRQVLSAPAHEFNENDYQSFTEWLKSKVEIDKITDLQALLKLIPTEEEMDDPPEKEMDDPPEKEMDDPKFTRAQWSGPPEDLNDQSFLEDDYEPAKALLKSKVEIDNITDLQALLKLIPTEEEMDDPKFRPGGMVQDIEFTAPREENRVNFITNKPVKVDFRMDSTGVLSTRLFAYTPFSEGTQLIFLFEIISPHAPNMLSSIDRLLYRIQEIRHDIEDDEINQSEINNSCTKAISIENRTSDSPHPCYRTRNSVSFRPGQGNCVGKPRSEETWKELNSKQSPDDFNNALKQVNGIQLATRNLEQVYYIQDLPPVYFKLNPTGNLLGPEGNLLGPDRNKKIMEYISNPKVPQSVKIEKLRTTLKLKNDPPSSERWTKWFSVKSAEEWLSNNQTVFTGFKSVPVYKGTCQLKK